MLLDIKIGIATAASDGNGNGIGNGNGNGNGNGIGIVIGVGIGIGIVLCVSPFWPYQCLRYYLSKNLHIAYHQRNNSKPADTLRAHVPVSPGIALPYMLPTLDLTLRYQVTIHLEIQTQDFLLSCSPCSAAFDTDQS